MDNEVVFDELSQIKKCINNNKNFLLSGGAGSGKTYTLVETIKFILQENTESKIACITYTNAATNEINSRIESSNLKVSTIHNFLWNNINNFQNDLKSSLLNLINDDEMKKIKKPSDFDELEYINDFKNGITYKEYLRIAEGQISHDELLILSNYMYKHYKLLCDILKDSYDFIFIDEYQDSNPEVIEIFLDFIEKSNKKCVIGLYGDSMQSIYDTGIGNVNKYIEEGKIIEIIKQENRRNPLNVINLANKLRVDSIFQTPSKDSTAPNMVNEKIKVGSIKFIYSNNKTIDEIKNDIHFENWDFENSKNTRELNLTHNLIAPRAGFEELMLIYDKDPIFSLKSDLLKKIKKDNITIDDTYTFGDVADQLNLKDREQNLRVQNLLKNVTNCSLYNMVKDKPFFEIKKMYIDKDMLIDNKKDELDDLDKPSSKRDRIIAQLFSIQNIINLYEENNINEFLKITDFKILNNGDRIKIKNYMDSLKTMSDRTIIEVINFADKHGLIKKHDKFNKFVEKNDYLAKRVFNVSYSCFQNLYQYLEGYTPFSTQHKIKGEEYNNVFVVLDSGNWNSYNFENLFDESTIKNVNSKVLERTKKIFYVCITRAKENLIVYYNTPTDKVLAQAKNWFGKNNVIEI